MAKLDLRSAYRMVPVHPQDQWLLEIEWESQIYLDRALPFGLRSAPKVFSAVADGLAWAMVCSGIAHPIHYLDDFFFCGPSDSVAFQLALDTAVPLCQRLGLPMAPDKVEGLTTMIRFLGIELDSVALEIRLPAVKLQRLKVALADWEGRHSATKQQLQSIIGHLSHAAKVVKPGRTFLRELIRTMTIPKAGFHMVRLNAQCRADIAWWSTFIATWNGVSLFPGLPIGQIVTSDASGSWGCGAFHQSQAMLWFQLQWPPEWAEVNIAVKELVPVTLSAAIWGHTWHKQKIVFKSDNMAVVIALNKRSAKDPRLAHLLRCLFFFEAHFGFEHEAQHIPGINNVGADALSRGDLTRFHSLFSQAKDQPTSKVPEPLAKLLFAPELSWTSPRWKSYFLTTLREVSRQQQPALTRPQRDGLANFACR